MQFALSTHWNAHRHTSGEAMIEEILGLGFRAVELGYDTRMDLVPGVQDMVRNRAVQIDSLHNFCPVPVAVTRGGPEIFTFAASDPRERESAVKHTTNTVRFAAEIGARFVVCHAGNVEMDQMSMALADLCARGERFSPSYERLSLKLQTERDRRIGRQLEYLDASLTAMLPVLEETGVTLCIENLPTWEAIPTEMEMEQLLRRFNHPRIACWHDVGHGQIRHNLGLINVNRWLDRLMPHVRGMHVHDVAAPAEDHVMPPRGCVDFERLKPYAEGDIVRVIEPNTRTPADHVAEALKFLIGVWGNTDGSQKTS